MSVANLQPVNKTAALVTSKGTHYEMKVKSQVPEYIGPPAMLPRNKLPIAPSLTDLTGRKKGRFTVVGMAAEGKGKWVVRCVCGTYTIRSSQSVKSVDKNPLAHFDACRECMNLAYLKREEIYRRTGKDANLSEVW